MKIAFLVRLERCQKCGKFKQSTELTYLFNGVKRHRVCALCYRILKHNQYEWEKLLAK